jgi:uridine kinase
LDPWSDFIAGGGPQNAFPYGFAMYLAHAPLVSAGLALDAVAGGQAFAQIGFALSLLMADLVILCALARMFEGREDEVVLLYWFSPIALFITYWHGQTDVVPVAFLIVSLLMLKERQPVAAALFYGLAVSAKLSMLIAAPFIALYVFKNVKFAALRIRFLAWSAVALTVGQVALIASPGFRRMTLENQEINRLFELRLPLSGDLAIYVPLLVYLGVVYTAFGVRRMNFDLLVAYLGVAFLIVLTLTPAAVGWFFWCVPFLTAYQLQGESLSRTRLLALAFALLFVLSHLSVASGAASHALGFDLTDPAPQAPARIASILTTLLVGAGIIIVASFYRRGVSQNDVFQLSQRPFAIGVSGDSGSGKDLLTSALADLFEPESVVVVRGDDFHRHERGSPAWAFRTHLDPRANDLKRFSQQVQALVRNRSAQTRQYDHSQGRFLPSARIASKDVVLVQGLHALYLESVRAELDVAIYLDMHDELRRYFKLRRDTSARGHAQSHVERAIAARSEDAQAFILPQRRHADIVFSLAPAADSWRCDLDGQPPTLKLTVAWRSTDELTEFARVMVGLCGLGLDQPAPDADGVTRFEVDLAEATSENIAFAAGRLAADLQDAFAANPKWAPGAIGVMQLIVMIELVRAVRERRHRIG